jgi:hypothetical protein
MTGSEIWEFAVAAGEVAKLGYALVALVALMRAFFAIGGDDEAKHLMRAVFFIAVAIFFGWQS